nr:immunoglobulin heavy chain junction region [Mus musculus]
CARAGDYDYFDCW